MKGVKKKILFVGNCQSVHLQRWINYFKRDSEVLVISSRPCKHRECSLLDELVPEKWRYLSSLPKIGFLIKATVVYRYLNTRKIDLVHIHQLGGFEARLGKIFVFLRFHPLIISTWGSDVFSIKDERTKVLRRFVLERADLVTATSNFLAKETRELAPRLKRLEVVPFGVDLEAFDSGRFRKPNNGILRIGFFKHLKLIYGPDYLLQAFALVLRKFPQAELFLAGKGEMDAELRILAKELGIFRKVRFLGFVDDVAEVMVRMDLTVMPSLRESFGVAALESQALGVPVVASRVGGTPEVIRDGETGSLVPPGDEKALADAIIKLLEDKNLRARMGKAGRKFVSENYNWQKNAKSMEGLYEELLNGNFGD